MSIPFYCVVRPEDEGAYIATRTDLKLRHAVAARAVLGALDQLFVAGRPVKPWPPFLPSPEDLRQERAELAACLVELGWRL